MRLLELCHVEMNAISCQARSVFDATFRINPFKCLKDPKSRGNVMAKFLPSLNRHRAQWLMGVAGLLMLMMLL